MNRSHIIAERMLSLQIWKQLVFCLFFSIDDMCAVFIFIFVFGVIRSVCWHLYIYIVKRRRPCFVGGAIEIPLIDWLIFN